LDLGFSILCDPLYGGNQKPFFLSDVKRSYKGDLFEERPLLSRLALHACSLEIIDPTTKEKRYFEAPLPKDMDVVRKQCAKLFKVDPLG
jgi:23S rRNA-/tRNA-specific pseudouridylate synthase